MTDRTVRYRLLADLSGFSPQMKNASESVKKFGSDLVALDKDGARMRAGLDQLAGTAGKIGLVAAAGLGAAVLKAADFDQAMSNIQAATHETAGNMDLLREAALQAGADTAFSATEAAAAVENLAKAGVSTADILGGGLSGALDLAAAGELQVADAAEIAATALTQFNLAGEDVPHVADLLAAGAGKAQGEVSDLSAALNQSGLVAAQTGLTIEETVGTLSAFASAGLMGSDAGTSFKTMLQSLTPSSKAARDEMERLGISAYDANGEFVGMAEFAGVLQNALAGMSVEQQNATMKTIFGSDAVRAAAVLFSQGAEGVQEWTDKVNDSGFAAETAAIKMDNLKGDWEEFTGALETALIGTGDGAQGPLRELVQMLTAVTNAYNDLPGAAKSATAATLGVVAVAGTGAFAFSKIIQGVASTREAMEALGISTDKVGGKMKGFAATAGRAAGIAAALWAISAAAEGLRSSLEGAMPGVSELTNELLELNGAQLSSISTEFDNLGSTVDRMANAPYWRRSSDAITSLLSLGMLDGREIDGAKQDIEALDAAFANMAATLGSDVAADALRDLADAENLTKDQTQDLIDLMPAYGEALAANETQSRAAEGSTASLGSAMDGLAGDAVSAEKEVASLSDALDALLGVEMDQDEALVNWKRSIQSLTEELKGGSNALDANTKKGQDNRDAIRDRVGALQRMIEADEAAGVGAKQMERKMLDGARAIVQAGAAAGISEGKMRSYLRQLGLTPKQIRTLISADTAAASAKVRTLEQELNRLARERIATVRVNYLHNPGKAPAGTAPNQTWATGGYTGDGGKYDPAGIVHRGEVVLPQEVVDRDARFLRERYGFLPGMGSLPGFAGGGMVGAVQSASKGKGTTVWIPGDAEDLTRKALKRMARELDKTTGHVAKAKDAMDDWASRMKSVGDSIKNQFAPDLFARPDVPTMSGGTPEMQEAQWRFIEKHLAKTTGPLASVNNAIAELEQRQLLQKKLQGAGVTGEAFEALVAQGATNADLVRLLNSGDAAEYAKQYAKYAKLSDAVAKDAGQIAFGEEFAKARHEWAAMNQELREQKQAFTRAEKQWEKWRKVNDDIGKKGQSAATRGVQKSKAKTGAKF